MILLSRSLKRLRSALLDSRVVILFFYLPFPLRILNSAISRSFQPRLPQSWHFQKILSCLYKVRWNSSPHHLLNHLFRKLSSMPSRNLLEFLCLLCWPCNRPPLQDLWVWDYFLLSEEGSIYFFPPDLIAVDADHDLTCALVLNRELSSGSSPSPRQSSMQFFCSHVKGSSAPHPFPIPS